MSDENFDYEDMVDSTDEMESTEVVSTGQSNQGQQEGMVEDVKPVKLSKGKVLFLLIAVIVVAILVLILVTEMGVVRNDRGSGQTLDTGNSVQTSVTSSTENVGDTSMENSDFSAVSGEGLSTSTGNGNLGETSGSQEGEASGTVKEVEVIKEQESEKEEVSNFNQLSVEPRLGAEIVVSGIVKGKSMYKVGDSYTYGVRLILVTGNDVNIECTYFCPKKTADALEIGDSLNVSYQCDSAGTVCVVSISR